MINPIALHIHISTRLICGERNRFYIWYSCTVTFKEAISVIVSSISKSWLIIYFNNLIVHLTVKNVLNRIFTYRIENIVFDTYLWCYNMTKYDNDMVSCFISSYSIKFDSCVIFIINNISFHFKIYEK